MSLIDCDSGVQPEWCPTKAEDVLPSIVGLLPPGPAFAAASIPGSVQNSFWLAISEIVAHIYKRLCDYTKEFHCSTVIESVDQWMDEYGLPDECDPYGKNICVKAAAIGGQDCVTFTEIARQAGWVITCEDVETPNMAGAFQVGCTPMGPTPVAANVGSNLGYGAGFECAFGEIVDHPEPRYWNHDKTHLASCPVPGSNLGQSSGAPDCCFIVGYYGPPEGPDNAQRNNVCSTVNPRIDFECPISVRDRSQFNACADDTSLFLFWGGVHTWRVIVDLQASYALQGIQYSPPIEDPLVTAEAASTLVGNAQVGCDPICDLTSLSASGAEAIAGQFQIGCAPICTKLPSADFILCFLEAIKPAHTTLVTKVV